MLGQFNVLKFVSSLKQGELSKSRCLHALRDKSLYALGFCSELLFTDDDTLLLSYDSYGHNDTSRKKAVFRHKAISSFSYSCSCRWTLLVTLTNTFQFFCCFSSAISFQIIISLWRHYGLDFLWTSAVIIGMYPFPWRLIWLRLLLILVPVTI